jgi:hypothetical protein
MYGLQITKILLTTTLWVSIGTVSLYGTERDAQKAAMELNRMGVTYSPSPSIPLRNTGIAAIREARLTAEALKQSESSTRRAKIEKALESNPSNPQAAIAFYYAINENLREIEGGGGLNTSSGIMRGGIHQPSDASVRSVGQNAQVDVEEDMVLVLLENVDDQLKFEEEIEHLDNRHLQQVYKILYKKVYPDADEIPPVKFRELVGKIEKLANQVKGNQIKEAKSEASRDFYAEYADLMDQERILSAETARIKQEIASGTLSAQDQQEKRQALGKNQKKVQVLGIEMEKVMREMEATNIIPGEKPDETAARLEEEKKQKAIAAKAREEAAETLRIAQEEQEQLKVIAYNEILTIENLSMISDEGSRAWVQHIQANDADPDDINKILLALRVGNPLYEERQKLLDAISNIADKKLLLSIKNALQKNLDKATGLLKEQLEGLISTIDIELKGKVVIPVQEVKFEASPEELIAYYQLQYAWKELQKPENEVLYNKLNYTRREDPYMGIALKPENELKVESFGLSFRRIEQSQLSKYTLLELKALKGALSLTPNSTTSQQEIRQIKAHIQEELEKIELNGEAQVTKARSEKEAELLKRMPPNIISPELKQRLIEAEEKAIKEKIDQILPEEGLDGKQYIFEQLRKQKINVCTLKDEDFKEKVDVLQISFETIKKQEELFQIVAKVLYDMGAKDQRAVLNKLLNLGFDFTTSETQIGQDRIIAEGKKITELNERRARQAKATKERVVVATLTASDTIKVKGHLRTLYPAKLPQEINDLFNKVTPEILEKGLTGADITEEKVDEIAKTK